MQQQRGLRLLYWLDDLGAAPITEALASDEGFLFAGARSIDDYRDIVAHLPRVGDRPEDREPLLRLDTVLERIQAANVDVPRPQTWTLPLDCELPGDLRFPLFVRTAQSSWKLGGRISRVADPTELREEMFLLRRALGWNSVILAREWLDLAAAGDSVYGPVPQEVRVWIVDGVPAAWSFHYSNVVPKPRGFPLSHDDLDELRCLAAAVGTAFQSRLIAADFARHTSGEWVFIEAGPGSCAGTSHEGVFKFVASRLVAMAETPPCDPCGGVLI